MFSKVYTIFFWFCCCSLVVGQSCLAATAQTRVDANQYASFWIWGNIQSATYLAKAKELYILQGEVRIIRGTQHSTLIPQGVSVLNIPKQTVWLVFRTHHLNWTDQELAMILPRIKQWENSGNHIQGIQIDFDARTNNLKQYALFLAKLRQKLPLKYQLSITGLLDWSNVQDQATLDLLRKNIDELVIQTYQGSTTIANYQAYLKRIAQLKLPYKIGLVQYGAWDSKLNSTLTIDPNFKGFVVFLLRDKKALDSIPRQNQQQFVA